MSMHVARVMLATTTAFPWPYALNTRGLREVHRLPTALPEARQTWLLQRGSSTARLV
jgi:hypothetical protein